MTKQEKTSKKISATVGSYPERYVQADLYYRTNKQSMTEVYFEIVFKQTRKNETFRSLPTSCSSEETAIKLAAAEIQRQVSESGFAGGALIHEHILNQYFDSKQKLLQV